MTSKQLKFIEKEMNGIIRRCLWAPSGDPSKAFLRRAAAAYIILHNFKLKIDGENDVVTCLKDACLNGDLLSAHLPFI